jgi:NAD(P)-dependent dehydrogenase (short-subunit alcohol dehydrogenase family)
MPDDLFSLEGRTALVTGASRGIGARIASVLDGAGARVALLARDEARLKAVASMLQHDPLVVAADAAGEVSLRAAVDSVQRKFGGGVDILVNNAGISKPTRATDVPLSDWDRILDINLRSAFVLAQALAPAMIAAGWGRIVNVASVMGHLGDAHGAAYSASKSGLVGLTRSLAVEWARRGITVNALCPGWIATDIVEELRANLKFEARVLGRVPMRRWGKPEDMDGALLFLTSDASAFMTGQSLVVDGGLMASW